jgi:exodeoxyribonuclease-3
MGETTLVSWNVNGLRAVAQKGFLGFVQAETPDILCIQETKATEAQVPDEIRHIDGYHAFFSSADRKGYSGVALYSRTLPRSIERGFGIDRFDREGRVLIAEYPEFLLFNIYFPNGKQSPERLAYKLDFYEACLSRVRSGLAAGRHVILCGDVNTAHTAIDLARPKQNERISGFLPEERRWIDRLIGEGFVDTFRLFTKAGGHYSWWDQRTRSRERNVGWRIDYFFVDAGMKERVRASRLYPEVTGSDHCPVGLILADPVP